MLPNMPDQEYSFFQMLPNGAAMLVTKEIMANMKNIVAMATTRVLLLLIVLYV